MASKRTIAPREWLDRLERTLEAFDETEGRRTLIQVFDELGVEDALSYVVLPYLQEVGQRWSDGSIGIAQEHFASNVLRSRLSVLMGAEERHEGPLAVLACMPGEHHEFGLMTTSIVLSRLGWRTCYLGASTPTTDVALSSLTLRPRAVIVAARRTTTFAAHAPVLRRVAQSTTVHLAAAGATDEVARLCHAVLLEGDPVQAARRLDGARSEARPGATASTVSDPSPPGLVRTAQPPS